MTAGWTSARLGAQALGEGCMSFAPIAATHGARCHARSRISAHVVHEEQVVHRPEKNPCLMTRFVGKPAATKKAEHCGMDEPELATSC